MRYALLLLSGAPVLAAAYSTKSYNLTLDDFSPLLMYDPPVGNLWPDVDKYEMSDTAWNCSFTASSWRTWSPWMVGGGKSYHWGQERGTMKVTWEGTGITVMGQSSQWYYGNATLEVGDNKGACTYGGTQGEMITCVLSGLPTGLHTATFTITKGQLTVGEVQLVADFMTDLDDPSTAATLDWKTNEDGALNSKITAEGFTPVSDTNSGQAQDVPRIYANTAGAYAEVKTPKLASIVQIIGSVDVDHSNYQVEVTPTPPSGQGKYEFSAFNPWTTPNQVLFSTQLDPSVEYTIRYTHLNESAQIYSDLSSFHFVLAEATKSDESAGSGSGGGGISSGAIAGIVIGVVILLAAIGLGWFFYSRRNRNTRSSRDRVPLSGSIDDLEPVYGPQPTPLYIPSPGHSSLMPMQVRNASSIHGSGYESNSENDWLQQDDYLSIAPGGMRDSHLSNMTFQSGAQSSASSIRGGVPMSKAEIVRQQQMAASESRGPLRHVIQQHADAGTVVADDDVDTVIEEVPPSYNPQWASSGPSERGPSPLSSSGPRKN